jgi:hypothetical protein
LSLILLAGRVAGLLTGFSRAGYAHAKAHSVRCTPYSATADLLVHGIGRQSSFRLVRGIERSMNAKPRLLLAAGFFGIWVAILYAGADHPPPIGFLWLIVLVLACATVVYLRVPRYATWSSTRRRGRMLLVVLDGAIAGLVTGSIPMVFRFRENPAVPDITVTGVLTWFAVLVAMGAVNAVLVYAITAVLEKRLHSAQVVPVAPRSPGTGICPPER